MVARGRGGMEITATQQLFLTFSKQIMVIMTGDFLTLKTLIKALEHGGSGSKIQAKAL